MSCSTITSSTLCNRNPACHFDPFADSCQPKGGGGGGGCPDTSSAAVCKAAGCVLSGPPGAQTCHSGSPMQGGCPSFKTEKNCTDPAKGGSMQNQCMWYNGACQASP
jgi:hypothetical protein